MSIESLSSRIGRKDGSLPRATAEVPKKYNGKLKPLDFLKHGKSMAQAIASPPVIEPPANGIIPSLDLLDPSVFLAAGRSAPHKEVPKPEPIHPSALQGDGQGNAESGKSTGSETIIPSIHTSATSEEKSLVIKPAHLDISDEEKLHHVRAVLATIQKDIA